MTEEKSFYSTVQYKYYHNDKLIGIICFCEDDEPSTINVLTTGHYSNGTEEECLYYEPNANFITWPERDGKEAGVSFAVGKLPKVEEEEVYFQNSLLYDADTMHSVLAHRLLDNLNLKDGFYIFYHYFFGHLDTIIEGGTVQWD